MFSISERGLLHTNTQYMYSCFNSNVSNKDRLHFLFNESVHVQKLNNIAMVVCEGWHLIHICRHLHDRIISIEEMFGPIKLV
jgi:hypothetical protein